MRRRGPKNAVRVEHVRAAPRNRGPKKRRAEGAHGGRDLAARPQERSAGGKREGGVLASRSQKRREDGSHGHMELRDNRRKARPTAGREEIDTEIEMRNLFYGLGVAYVPAAGRGIPLGPRAEPRPNATSRPTPPPSANWRGECSLEERASAIGSMLKDETREQDGPHMRARKQKLQLKKGVSCRSHGSSAYAEEPSARHPRGDAHRG